MGTNHFHLKSPVALAAVDPIEAYNALREVGPDKHAFLGVDQLPRLWPREPGKEGRPNFELVLLDASGLEAQRKVMTYQGQGTYTSILEVTGDDLGFVIAPSGDEEDSLYLESMGQWPVAREGVFGPGRLPSVDHAWWLEGSSPGTYMVQFDDTGRRNVTLQQQ